MPRRRSGKRTPFGAPSRVAILLAALLSLPGAGSVSADEISIIDAHSQVDHHVDLDGIIPLMDKGGVSRTILAARGKVKPNALAAFAARHPGRITAAVRTKGRIYMQNQPKYYRLLRKQLAMPRFGAMAEVMMWHAEKGNPLNPKAPEVVVYPDDERVQVALRAALERGWPFVAHIEFAAAGPDRDVFMGKFEELLGQHPDHPFALIHMGQLEANEVRRLIEAHANAYFLTSHANPIVVSRSRQPWVNLFDGETLAPEWKNLVIQHPDRFILAFDNVWADHWGSIYLDQIALWRKALKDLPHAVAHAVAHRNAERLWRLPAAR